MELLAFPAFVQLPILAAVASAPFICAAAYITHKRDERGMKRQQRASQKRTGLAEYRGFVFAVPGTKEAEHSQPGARANREPAPTAGVDPSTALPSPLTLPWGYDRETNIAVSRPFTLPVAAEPRMAPLPRLPRRPVSPP